MLLECSNFKARSKKCGNAIKILTIVAVVACSLGAPLAARAQSAGSVINQGLSALTGSTSIIPRNLPPTNLDSFVYQAGGAAEMIYGDESTSLPPLFGFTQASRINAGISGQNAAGLTTGHGSYMPSAWGADEFLASPGEWCQSGTNNYNGAAAGLDAADQASAALAASQATANAASTLSSLTTAAVSAATSAVEGAVSGAVSNATSAASSATSGL